MDKKAISDHLIDALNKEDLPRREAARFLNLNPCYVTMAQNPNSWDAMGKTAWERMEAWHLTREKKSDFKIPEGEEIWKPKEAPEEHSPENLTLKNEAPFDESLVRPKKDRIKPKKQTTRVEKSIPSPEDHFTDTARLRVALDIEINLIINGQKIRLA